MIINFFLQRFTDNTNLNDNDMYTHQQCTLPDINIFILMSAILQVKVKFRHRLGPYNLL
jgi:hypothetical protein